MEIEEDVVDRPVLGHRIDQSKVYRVLLAVDSSQQSRLGHVTEYRGRLLATKIDDLAGTIDRDDQDELVWPQGHCGNDEAVRKLHRPRIAATAPVDAENRDLGEPESLAELLCCDLAVLAGNLLSIGASPRQRGCDQRRRHEDHC